MIAVVLRHIQTSPAAACNCDLRCYGLLADVARDEEWHLQWITAKLNELAANGGDDLRLACTLERYRTLEHEVYSEIEEYENGLLRR